MSSQPAESRITGSLQLRELARGSVWYARFRGPDGRQRQKALGPVWLGRGRPPDGFLTRRLAEDALAALISELRRAPVLAESPESVGSVSAGHSGVTFADVAGQWFTYLRDDRQRKASTLTGYRSTLQADLLPEFGEMGIAEITQQIIEAYRRKLLASGLLSARSINKRLVMLHSIFRYAQRVHGLAANPAVHVERQPLKRSKEIRVYVPDEIERLAEACAQGPQEFAELDSAVVRFAAYTGLRLGEIRALAWRAVDTNKRIVHVRRNFVAGVFDTPKSGLVRSVPLADQPARVLAILAQRDEFAQPDDLVFPGRLGRPFDDSAFRTRYYNAIRRSGLRRLTFHELRHTFGTLAAEGFPIADVQALLGHADITTTQIYLHLIPKTDAAERLSRLFDTTSPPG